MTLHPGVRRNHHRGLAQVYGVDLNPYAVAITRFRLVVAALHACGMTDLANGAPAWPLNVAGPRCSHAPGHGDATFSR